MNSKLPNLPKLAHISDSKSTPQDFSINDFAFDSSCRVVVACRSRSPAKGRQVGILGRVYTSWLLEKVLLLRMKTPPLPLLHASSNSGTSILILYARNIQIISTTYIRVVSIVVEFFKYSEKATRFCKISTLDLTVLRTVKSKMEISQNFVAFSEYMNFTKRIYCTCSNLLQKDKNSQIKNLFGSISQIGLLLWAWFLPS